MMTHEEIEKKMHILYLELEAELMEDNPDIGYLNLVRRRISKMKKIYETD